MIERLHNQQYSETQDTPSRVYSYLQEIANQPLETPITNSDKVRATQEITALDSVEFGALIQEINTFPDPHMLPSPIVNALMQKLLDALTEDPLFMDKFSLWPFMQGWDENTELRENTSLASKAYRALYTRAANTASNLNLTQAIYIIENMLGQQSQLINSDVLIETLINVLSLENVHPSLLGSIIHTFGYSLRWSYSPEQVTANIKKCLDFTMPENFARTAKFIEFLPRIYNIGDEYSYGENDSQVIDIVHDALQEAVAENQGSFLLHIRAQELLDTMDGRDHIWNGHDPQEHIEPNIANLIPDTVARDDYQYMMSHAVRNHIENHFSISLKDLSFEERIEFLQFIKTVPLEKANMLMLSAFKYLRNAKVLTNIRQMNNVIMQEITGTELLQPRHADLLSNIKQIYKDNYQDKSEAFTEHLIDGLMQKLSDSHTTTKISVLTYKDTTPITFITSTEQRDNPAGKTVGMATLNINPTFSGAASAAQLFKQKLDQYTTNGWRVIVSALSHNADMYQKLYGFKPAGALTELEQYTHEPVYQLVLEPEQTITPNE